MILLDSPVLSTVFRRPRRATSPELPVVTRFRELVLEAAPLVIPGIVLQEVLSGATSPEHHDRLVRLLEGFPVAIAGERDHRLAAEIFNRCRWQGIATGTADCLIAAQTHNAKAELFTLDVDFVRIARVTGLRLLAF